MDPGPLTVHVTAELYAPVPLTVAVHVDVCVAMIEVGVHETLTDVTVGEADVTVTVPEPNFVESCTEVAVHDALPTAVGVRTPPDVIVPFVAVQVTAELKAPVPVTVATHVTDWPIVTDEGKPEIVTEVIVGGIAVTVTFAELDFVESCVEVAVHVEVPTPVGVSTPPDVIVPFVAVQVTAELKAPVP
jgi:hypothetical protein